jgi:GNAT superfamily N-acetyltransferase
MTAHAMPAIGREGSTLAFREATAADVPMLALFNERLIADEWGGGMSRERLEERFHRWLADGDYRALLFVEGGETVAYALVSVDEDSAYVRHFYVVDAHRARGVGRRAIALLLRDVVPPTMRITLDVLASNAVGHRFWRSVGFTDYAVRMERLPVAAATAPTPSAAEPEPAARGGPSGCGAVERGASSPLLAGAYTKRFRWEVLPEPNPDCARIGAMGEADAEGDALVALREALVGHQAGFGVLYEVAGDPPRAREVQRLSVQPPMPKPPAW